MKILLIALFFTQSLAGRSQGSNSRNSPMESCMVFIPKAHISGVYFGSQDTTHLVVRSIGAGKVIGVSNTDNDCSILVKDDSLIFYFNHLNQVFKVEGDTLAPGVPIGSIIKNTKVFFQVFKGRKPIDPLPYLQCSHAD